MSEALIFASTNPQYDDRFVHWITGSIHENSKGRKCCVQKLFLTFRTIFVHNMFSPCSVKRRADDKDSPVHIALNYKPRSHWRSTVQTALIERLNNVVCCGNYMQDFRKRWPTVPNSFQKQNNLTRGFLNLGDFFTMGNIFL